MQGFFIKIGKECKKHSVLLERMQKKATNVPFFYNERERMQEPCILLKRTDAQPWLLTTKNGQNDFFESQYLFFAFSKIPTKRPFVRLLFLMLNQSQNTKTTFFWGGASSKTKNAFLLVQNGTFLKTNFKFVFLCLFFNVKGSSLQIFIQKY